MRLEGSRAKLRRAHEHFEALAGHISAFFQAHPYRIVIDNPAEELHVLRVDSAPKVPLETWALMIGDCVHNCRCALDYIAWQLGGSKPGDRQTQFPIFDSPDGWKTKAPRRIASMKPEARAFIQSMQPYHGGRPKKEALNGIRILDDADKHQLLTVVAALPSDISITWAMPGRPDQPPRDPILTLALHEPLRQGAIVGTLIVPGATEEVKMEIEFAPDVAFGESFGFGPRVHVLNSLSFFLLQTQNVIEAFEAKPELFPAR